jgi:hypothetical protein
MNGLTQVILQQLAGSGVSRISRQIGADEDATRQALQTVVPLLLAGLAKNASEPQGAESLLGALAADHDGSVLDDLGSFLENPDMANGAGILRHVLGAGQPAITEQVAKESGLDVKQLLQLLQIVAPLVMGALGRQRQQEDFDADDLTDYLERQQQAQRQQSPDIMDVLNGMLDANKSGSAMDDIIGGMGSILGNR